MTQKMTRRTFIQEGSVSGALLGGLLTGNSLFAEQKIPNNPLVNTEILLPEPIKTGGLPLMDALAARKSSREFSRRTLDKQILSNLLWAADGINRDDGRRTVPSPHNTQEISLYLILPDGICRYDAVENKLVMINPGNHRDLTGVQAYTHAVPLTVFFVADLKKLTFGGSLDDKKIHAAVDAGFIGQNIYLFAASNNLAAVFRSSIERDKIAERFKLEPDQMVLFAQSVGYRPGQNQK